MKHKTNQYQRDLALQIQGIANSRTLAAAVMAKATSTTLPIPKIMRTILRLFKLASATLFGCEFNQRDARRGCLAGDYYTYARRYSRLEEHAIAMKVRITVAVIVG